jgi:hypothetical protein
LALGGRGCRRNAHAFFRAASDARGWVGHTAWPLSRERNQQQLIGQIGGESLLDAMLRRRDEALVALVAAAHNLQPVDALATSTPLMACRQDLRLQMRERLEQCSPPAHMVLEPAARNTVPALTATRVRRGAHARGVRCDRHARRAATCSGYIRTGMARDTGGHDCFLLSETTRTNPASLSDLSSPKPPRHHKGPGKSDKLSHYVRIRTMQVPQRGHA